MIEWIDIILQVAVEWGSQVLGIIWANLPNKKQK